MLKLNCESTFLTWNELFAAIRGKVELRVNMLALAVLPSKSEQNLSNSV